MTSLDDNYFLLIGKSHFIPIITGQCYMAYHWFGSDCQLMNVFQEYVESHFVYIMCSLQVDRLFCGGVGFHFVQMCVCVCVYTCMYMCVCVYTCMYVSKCNYLLSTISYHGICFCVDAYLRDILFFTSSTQPPSWSVTICPLGNFIRNFNITVVPNRFF